MICKTSVNNGREWLDKTVKTQLLSILWSVWPQPYLLTRTNCSSHPLMVMVTLMVMQVIQPSSFFYLSTQSSWRNWFSVISPWLLCDVINVNCHNVDMIILSAVPAHHRLPSCVVQSHPPSLSAPITQSPTKVQYPTLFLPRSSQPQSCSCSYHPDLAACTEICTVRQFAKSEILLTSVYNSLVSLSSPSWWFRINKERQRD